MKITGSTIAMSGTHMETSYAYKETVTVEAAKSNDAAGAILTLSKEAEGKTYAESMQEYKKMQQEASKSRADSESKSLQNMLERMNATNQDSLKLPEEEDWKVRMLKRLLAALKGEKVSDDEKPKSVNGVTDMRSARFKRMEEASFCVNATSVTALQAQGSGAVSIGTGSFGTTWQRITASSGFAVEAEHTTFASVGMAQTADGRTIDFNIEVSMSRAFMSSIDMLEVSEYIKTDPLIINLDSDVASVTDQKFFFDLDSDGKEEEISFAGKGSGFLALDQNGDGKINNGSELFGTKSGDGFADLAAYDEDGNGWIDENDSVFSRLKIWTKDEDGNDYLMDLKKADVGAIYLGSADTQFSLKNEENQLNAEIKKTGIYLKESSGSVGTLNHIDLVV